MAELHTYGTAHVYGLYGTVTELTIQSDDLAQSLGLDVEVTDDTGRVITNRLDDLRKEVTLEGVLKTTQSIVAGDRLTYNSISYIVKSVDDKGTNKDFRKVSIKGIKYQEIA